MAFDVLKELGSFGLQRTWGNSEEVFDFGDGYFVAYSYGLPEGLKSWKLVLNFLPQGGTPTPTFDSRNLSRLDYILDFYDRNKIQGTKVFIIPDLADGKSYLARFVGPALSLTMIGQKFWKGDGLDIQQVRLKGYGDNGVSLTSPGPVPNPDSI